MLGKAGFLYAPPGLLIGSVVAEAGARTSLAVAVVSRGRRESTED